MAFYFRQIVTQLPRISKIWRIQPDGTGLLKLGDVIGLDTVQLPNGHILFSDETTGTGAVATVTDLDVVSGTRRIINDIRGRFTPIDIRPESPVNAIDPNSKGTVLVAILSRPGFDATVKVDTSTLTFGHSGTEQSFVGCEKNSRDVNRDGLPDLICRFNIPQAGFQPATPGEFCFFKTWTARHSKVLIQFRSSQMTIDGNG